MACQIEVKRLKLKVGGISDVLSHMYNVSVFYCKGNEISSKGGDFLVEGSTISGFAIEGVSGLRESEGCSEQSFLLYFNSDSSDGLRSGFFDGLLCGDVLFPEFFLGFDDV